jgi:CubicO group peptidase (beta-lactamase class C family)
VRQVIYSVLFLIFLILLPSCSDDEKGLKPGGVYGSGVIYPLNEKHAMYSARIDSFFQNRFVRGLFNGAVLIAEGNNIIYQNALGYGNFRSKDTLTIESQFQLASVTKPLTAYAIMLLEKKGMLSFQDSIRHFFPDFPYENITVHQLLIHRSGLPAYMYFADEFWKEDERDITINNFDVIDLMIEYEPMRYYYPGQRYNYNNTNYSMLAAIIEKVTSMTYENYMKENVFDELDMLNSSVYNRETDPEKNYPVKGYTGYRRTAGNTYLNGVVGDKGIYSTVEDLFKFNRAIFENIQIDSLSMSVAYQLGHEELHEHDNYGYGWRINMRSDSTKIAYHTGWWKGFRSYFIRELNTEKCIIVLTNRSNSGVLGTKELCELFDINTEIE